MENFIEPILIKAGSDFLRLGSLRQRPSVDCRVISEDQYQLLMKMASLSEKARYLVGNPGTGISGSTDLACDEWQNEYKSLTE